MLIEFLQSIGGDGFQHKRGDVIEWNTEEAERFIAAGIAKAAVPAVQNKKETMDLNDKGESFTKRKRNKNYDAE